MEQITIRDKKGKSLIEFPSEYILIDIETTGLSPIYNEIIEISALKIKEGEVVSKFSELVKPDNQIDSFIESLTGISNEMVKNCRKVKEVIMDFKNFIGEESILVGYNVNFDINFLYDNLLKFNNKYLENNFVDIMRIAKLVLKDEVESFRLKRLAKSFKLDVIGMHRAEKDCHICKEIFEIVTKKTLEKYGDLEKFKEEREKAKRGVCSKDIISNNQEFDESHLCYLKEFVFTGTLNKMPRREAMQLVVDKGGKVKDGVTKTTNYLVIGALDYSKTITGDKSSKIIKAEKLKLKDGDIELISEDVFYDMFEI